MAAKRKIPLRKCIACQERRDKRELLRIVRTPAGDVEIDETGKKAGRGSYICFSEACLQKALKDKSFERALQVKIKEDLCDKLTEIIRIKNEEQ